MENHHSDTVSGKFSLTRFKNNFIKIFTGKYAIRNIIILTLFIFAFGYIYYIYFASKTETTYEYTTAIIKDIKKTVEGSGKVVSASELQIQQLQGGGKIVAVNVKPGDYVKAGQIIARLDSRSQSIQLQQAEASYNKLINGSTKEDLDISNQSVTNAKLSYDIVKQQQDTAVSNARRTLLNSGISPIPVYDSRVQPNAPTISGSYTCTEDVVYNIKFSTNDFVSVTSSNETIGLVRISSVPQAIGKCGLYISFDLDNDFSNGEWKVELPNKISTAYSSNLNAYENALMARDQALTNANTSIINAQLSLNQKTAGARAEDIASSKASLDSARLNYENTIIRAPFAGQIGAVSAAVGQQTNSQQGVATIITKDKIAQISLNEIDIVNVKLSQPVELTFDAIPDEIFQGTVSEINTVGEVASNVVSFAVKISIPNADERIKSGMSVTANIITDEKKSVLTLPSGTIKTEGKDDDIKSYVLKQNNKSDNKNSSDKNLKTFVSTGMSNDIDTEILDGINEGDKVVSKTIDGTAVKKTTNTFSLFGARPGATGGARTGSGTTR